MLVDSHRLKLFFVNMESTKAMCGSRYPCQNGLCIWLAASRVPLGFLPIGRILVTMMNILAVLSWHSANEALSKTSSDRNVFIVSLLLGPQGNFG